MGRIGFFDSGFGGLSVLKEVRSLMPLYNFIYLADTRNAPYGELSQEEIFEHTRRGVEFLFDRGAVVVVLACNTASSEALRKLQQEFLPKFIGRKILGVIIPAVEEAIVNTKNNRIGVLATTATINSHAFEREVRKLSNASVFEIPAPKLVPLIEEGEVSGEEIELLISEYVAEVIKNDIDTLILGCTHYGIVDDLIAKYSGGVKIIQEGEVVARKLRDYLERHSDIDNGLNKDSSIKFFTTGEASKFDIIGSKIFGSDIKSAKIDLI